MSSRSPASILYDAYGNPVATLDGYNLVVTSPGLPVMGRRENGTAAFLLLGTDGSLQISTSVTPTNLSNIVNTFLVNGASSPDLLVNGSSTPVLFNFNAHSTLDTFIVNLKFIAVATDIQIQGTRFLDKTSALTNGILVQVRSNSNTVDLHNIQISEDFLTFSGGFGGNTGDFLDQTDSNDVMTSTFSFGSGVKLVAGSGDFIRVTIRDNVTDAGNKYLRALVKGYRTTAS